MLKKWEIEQLRRLKIVYYETEKFHALPYGKDPQTGMTELQFARAVLDCSAHKAGKKVREYLEILDKNCKYNGKSAKNNGNMV